MASYIEETIRSYELLANQPNSIFLGQSLAFPGNVIYKTTGSIDVSKKIEMPICEEMQMGLSIGLALNGHLPISIYPRFNFLLLAINQLVNHLDKIPEISKGGFNPKVIIKVMVGSKFPLYPGIQHCGNFLYGIKSMVDNIAIEDMDHPNKVYAAHEKALERKGSTILVEYGDLYNI